VWGLINRTHEGVEQNGLFRYTSSGEEGENRRFEIWPLEGSADVSGGCILTLVYDDKDGEPEVIENFGVFPDEEAAQLEAEVRDSGTSETKSED
jgi:hypothetical protein